MTGETWIDGRPIYRQVKAVDALPNTAVQTVYFDNSGNPWRVIKAYGFAYKADNNDSEYGGFPIIHAGTSGSTSNDVSLSWANGNRVFLTTYRDFSSYSAYIIVEYIKSTGQ